MPSQTAVRKSLMALGFPAFAGPFPKTSESDADCGAAPAPANSKRCEPATRVNRLLTLRSPPPCSCREPRDPNNVEIELNFEPRTKLVLECGRPVSSQSFGTPT